MDGEVPKSVAQRRGGELRETMAKKREVFLAAQIGLSLSVVTLDRCESDARLALSSNYLKVALPSSHHPPRRLFDVRIARTFGGILYGYPQARS